MSVVTARQPDSVTTTDAAAALADVDVVTAARSQGWRTAARPPRAVKPPKNADAVWEWGAAQAAVRRPRGRGLLREAGRVLRLSPRYESLDDAGLDDRLAELRAAARRGRMDRLAVRHALAAIREAARRELGLSAYREQVAAALAMHRGLVAEVATGEGKTLAAGLLAVLRGWRGRGCHVVTVNDYLARRDADDVRPLLARCGLSVAAIVEDTPPPDRRAAYHADVTYATNKTLAADFLRDRLDPAARAGASSRLVRDMLGSGEGHGPGGGLMRGLECAVVDEADSILIDEAVTPLILSGPMPNDEQAAAFERAAGLGGHMQPRRDYRVDHKHREVRLTGAGRARLAELTRDEAGVWASRRRGEELVAQALTAAELFHRDQHYVVQDGKVVIVDEFTGRLMPDRTWRDGLHQAVEAKEQLDIQPPKGTLARVSFQRFFRLYRHLGGMTGTAAEARVELWRTYRLPVVRVPTHRPCIRRQPPPEVFASGDPRNRAIVERITAEHARGRPVLVGTRSVGASETLSTLLDAAGVRHRVLNAVRHAEEAEIVKLAGQRKTVTIATNMAGRGTDIKLAPGVAELGGLLVIAAEPNDAKRVDRQLFGRAARQGDPGEAAAMLALDDELFTRHARRRARLLTRLAPALPRPLTRRLARQLQRSAQTATGRRAAALRRHVLLQDHELHQSLGFAPAE